VTAKEVLQDQLALVVHADMGALSKYQAALAQRGVKSIVARDLPTALLAMTQHYFRVAIVSSQLAEGGDGWPLVGVLHLVFPRAFIAVVSPTEPDVLMLQSAINYGAREVFHQSKPVEEIVESIVAQQAVSIKATGKSKVQ
jgi:ActR/RegA family two-component response regulator